MAIFRQSSKRKAHSAHLPAYIAYSRRLTTPTTQSNPSATVHFDNDTVLAIAKLFVVFAGIRSWFSRSVVESVFGSGFAIDFILAFSTHSGRVLNSPCHRTASPNSTRILCLKCAQISFQSNQRRNLLGLVIRGLSLKSPSQNQG